MEKENKTRSYASLVPIPDTPNASLVPIPDTHAIKHTSPVPNQENLNTQNKIKKSQYNIRDMNRSELNQLTKDQLINLLLQNNTKTLNSHQNPRKRPKMATIGSVATPRTAFTRTARYTLGNDNFTIPIPIDDEPKSLKTNVMKELSENYYDAAKKLGYTWNDHCEEINQADGY